MNESYFKYGEYVNLVGDPQLYIVVCTKHVSVPNGTHGYQYQIQNEHGSLYREDGTPWINQSKLRKLHQPGEMDFKTLMDHLKNDIIKRSDFE